jgi:hypothetical protein
LCKADSEMSECIKGKKKEKWLALYLDYFVYVSCRNTEAAQAAAQAAARINQQLGVSSPNSSMMQQQNDQMNLGGGMVITEEYKVPDRMVGLSK